MVLDGCSPGRRSRLARGVLHLALLLPPGKPRSPWGGVWFASAVECAAPSAAHTKSSTRKVTTQKPGQRLGRTRCCCRLSVVGRRSSVDRSVGRSVGRSSVVGRRSSVVVVVVVYGHTTQSCNAVTETYWWQVTWESRLLATPPPPLPCQSREKLLFRQHLRKRNCQMHEARGNTVQFTSASGSSTICSHFSILRQRGHQESGQGVTAGHQLCTLVHSAKTKTTRRAGQEST